jgi:hypothetical protein
MSGGASVDVGLLMLMLMVRYQDGAKSYHVSRVQYNVQYLVDRKRKAGNITLRRLQ